MPLARNIATVGGATLISRVLGFTRDAGIAALFGSSPFAQAFFAVLQLINFFRRLLAEGAINGAFTPVWLRLKSAGGAPSSNRLTRRVFFIAGVASSALAILCVVLAPPIARAVAPGFEDTLSGLTAFYLIYAIPYIAFAGPVAVLAAALNAEGRFGAVALSAIVFNLVMLAAVAAAYTALYDELFLAGVWLSAGILLSGFVQLMIVTGAWLWKSQRFAAAPARPNKETRQFLLGAAPALVFAGIPQLKALAGAAIASSSAAGVSWLYYANRLYELPLGVVSIAIAAVLVPLIAKSVHDGAQREIASAQTRALEIALGLSLPAALAFIVLAQPIAGALFERGLFKPQDTAAVAAALAALAAGLPGHVLEKMLGAVSFAHDDTRTPMWAALAGFIAAVAAALALFPRYGHVGIAAAIAASGWAGAILLGIILARRRWLQLEAGAIARLLRIFAAAAIMAALLTVANAALPSFSGTARIAALIVLIALGLGVYLAAIQALGIARIGGLISAARKRL